MTTQTQVAAPELSGDQEARARIRDVVIEQFGQHGFDTELPAIAEAVGREPRAVDSRVRLAQIESFAPMMNYLVRSMLSGGELGHALMVRMIDNAEGYLEDAVRAGTIKPSRGPKARAAFLAISGGGGFLLYLHMHDNPTDMAAVLRDYGKDMILPALEVYSHALLTDTTMYDTFVARQQEAQEARTAE